MHTDISDLEIIFGIALMVLCYFNFNWLSLLSLISSG